MAHRRETSKGTIAVLFPLMLGGGAEAVTAWILEALKASFRVKLFSLNQIGPEELNKLYGTNIARHEVEFVCPENPLLGSFWAWAAKNLYKKREFFIRRLLSFFRKHSMEAPVDLAISGYNEMSFPGIPGMQYVHNPSGSSREDIKNAYDENLTLANSRHTADTIREKFGVKAKVLVPPIMRNEATVPWQKKRPGFVCVGRLVEDKMAHRAIKVIARVRAEGYDVHIHIVGTPGSFKYEALLRKYAKKHPEWVFLHKRLSRDGLKRLQGEHRFGIHMKPEPFGMTSAEMMVSGGIPFARRHGGAGEVVGELGELLFDNDDEAAEKIITLLSSESLQQRITSELEVRRSLFGTERFVQEIRAIVGDRIEAA